MNTAASVPATLALCLRAVSNCFDYAEWLPGTILQSMWVAFCYGYHNPSPCLQVAIVFGVFAAFKAGLMLQDAADITSPSRTRACIRSSIDTPEA